MQKQKDSFKTVLGTHGACTLCTAWGEFVDYKHKFTYNIPNFNIKLIFCKSQYKNNLISVLLYFKYLLILKLFITFSTFMLGINIFEALLWGIIQMRWKTDLK